jgi:hypothetical protein
MNTPSRLENVLSFLSDNGLHDLLPHFRHPLAALYPGKSKGSVSSGRVGTRRRRYLRRLLIHVPSTTSVTQWALQTTRSALRSEIEELTKRAHGLHFDAWTATAEQIESTFMPRLAVTMRQVAPSFWSLIFDLLGALDDRRKSLTVDPFSMNLAEVFEESERVLEEIGGDMEADDDRGERADNNDADLGREDDLPHQKRSRKGVSERNTAIRVIVSYNYIGSLFISLCM